MHPSTPGVAASPLCFCCGAEAEPSHTLVDEGHLVVACRICYLTSELVRLQSERQLDEGSKAVVIAALTELVQFLHDAR